MRAGNSLEILQAPLEVRCPGELCKRGPFLHMTSDSLTLDSISTWAHSGHNSERSCPKCPSLVPPEPLGSCRSRPSLVPPLWSLSARHALPTGCQLPSPALLPLTPMPSGQCLPAWPLPTPSLAQPLAPQPGFSRLGGADCSHGFSSGDLRLGQVEGF